MTDFKPLEPDQLAQAAAFDKLVDRPLNTTFDADFYAWQYLRSGGRTQSRSPAIAAWADDQVVATAMLSDIDVWAGESLVKGSFLHEWYAAANHGFVGLELLASVLDRLPMIIGAGPSMSSMVTFKRIRPLRVVPLQRLVLVVDPKRSHDLSFEQSRQSLAYLQSLTPRGAKPGAVMLDRFDDAYDQVWLGMRAGLQVAADRTAAYMNWRYFEHPRFRYYVARCDGGAGAAYFVWRIETVPAGAAVARLCDAIGTPDALAAAVPQLLALWKQIPDFAFGDFFCTNDAVCAALLDGGFAHALTMPGLDLPRLFSPLAADLRKTLYFYFSYAKDLRLSPRFEPGRSYFTKGDSNQDRPNP